MRCLGDPLPRPVVRENPSGRAEVLAALRCWVSRAGGRGEGRGGRLLGDTASLPFQLPGPHVRRSWLQVALPGGARVPWCLWCPWCSGRGRLLGGLCDALSALGPHTWDPSCPFREPSTTQGPWFCL